MKISGLIIMPILSVVGSAFAQNNFSSFIELNTQPTENIKVKQVIVGGNLKYNFKSKFKINNETTFESQNLIYSNANNTSSILTQFEKLASNLTLSYSNSNKYVFNLNIQPIIANENKMKWKSLDVMVGATVDFKLKHNDVLTIGFGNSSIFGKPALIPTISYLLKYNEKTKFSIGFPETKVSYSNNPRNIFLLKNKFHGNFFTLDNEPSAFYNYSTKASFSQITSSLEYERNVDTKWYINFKAGYDFNKKYVLLDNNYNKTYDFNITDGFNIGFSIIYKH